MRNIEPLIQRAKVLLVTSAVTLFVLGLVINWLGNPIRIVPLALTPANSGVIELSYLLGIGYIVLHLAENRLTI